MRCLFLISVLLSLVSGCSKLEENSKKNSEQSIQSETEDSGDVIICEIPIEAETNIQEWRAYLQNSLILDDASLDTIPAGTYTVVVQFVIDDKGKIRDVTIMKDAGYGLGQRGVKAIEHYEGLWKPSIQDGRATISYRRQPITFLVEEDDE